LNVFFTAVDEQAKGGRVKILEEMRRAFPDPPRSLKDSIPKVLGFTIPPELIGKRP
jgi:polyribonucleotide nucleotidyltransferase